MRFVQMLLVMLVAVMTVVAPCQADKLLRWKLQPGQRFQVDVTQDSQTETTVNSRTVKLSLNMGMSMLWTVDSVDQAGVATISQTFTRIRVGMDTPSVGKVAFDTSEQVKPGELTEGMADALGPLINAKFTVHMTPRGEIVKVDIPTSTVAAIKEASATSKLRQLLSVDGLTQLLRQSLATLPEQAAKPDERWSVKMTTASPLGQLKQVNHYTYEGTVEREEQQLEKINVETELSLEPSKDSTSKKLAIKSHKQTGWLLFDAESGRFVASEIEQSLVSQTPFQNLKIDVSVQTTSRSAIREAKPEAVRD